jgi:hypothetical protein
LLLFATWVSLNQPNAPLVAVAEKFLAGHPENPLAPFLDQLTSDFDSAAMLIDKIDVAFDVLDTDGTERVDFSKLAEGLFRYNCASSRTYQRFSEQAWAHLTQNGSLCFDGHALDRRSFRMMMLEQIRMFIQSKATDALRAGAEDSPATSAQLMILKFMCIETLIINHFPHRCTGPAFFAQVRCKHVLWIRIGICRSPIAWLKSDGSYDIVTYPVAD